MKCLICRKKLTIWNKSVVVPSIYDIDTEEKYGFCTKCAPRLLKSQAFPVDKSQGARNIYKTWFNRKILSLRDIERIEQDSLQSISAKYFDIPEPTFAIWINDLYLIADINREQIMVGTLCINFNEISSYQIFDNSVEISVENPTSSNYTLKTHHGLRRTIIGGIFGGPIGAAMGGLTSQHSLNIEKGQKSSYRATEHNYKVLINLNSLKNGGSVIIEIGNEAKTEMLINMLNKIII